MFTHTSRSILGRDNRKSIETTKPSGSRKAKQQPTTGSRAAVVEEEQEGALEPEDVMMVEVT
jgi:hypothetical protein